MDIKEAMAHAGGMIDRTTGGEPGWVEDRVREAMPHYIWTWQKGRRKTGVCTRCGARLERLDKLRIAAPEEMESEGGFMGKSRVSWMREHWDGTAHHGKTGLCPCCGQEVTFRSLDKGYKNLEDKLFLVEYRASAIEPGALVCMGYRVLIPWGEMAEERIEPPLYITPMEICVFRWGKGGQRFIQDTKWVCVARMSSGRDLWAKKPTGKWSRRRACVSGCTGQASYMGNDATPVMLGQDAFDMAVEGTRWEAVLKELPWTEASQYNDQITLMDRISRYPCVEYLLKLGYGELAQKVVDREGEGLLNLRGKTARAVLGLTADEWGFIKGNKVRVDMELLAVLRHNRTRKLGLSMPACVRLAENRDLESLRRLEEVRPAVNIKAACKYVRRQHARLGDYLDYLRQCRLLGADMTARQVLWPTNLDEMHRRYTVQINQMDRERYAQARIRSADADETLTKKLQERWKELQGRYCFRACGLVLSPFRTAADIIREGARQSICIGSYVERYAEGKTILCSLRREETPEEPFHAVEFTTGGAMVQCRGYENKTFDVDEQAIRDFWAAWDEARGTKTSVDIIIQATEKTDKKGHAA